MEIMEAAKSKSKDKIEKFVDNDPPRPRSCCRNWLLDDDR
jgi:hypothetical protein